MEGIKILKNFLQLIFLFFLIKLKFSLKIKLLILAQIFNVKTQIIKFNLIKVWKRTQLFIIIKLILKAEFVVILLTIFYFLLQPKRVKRSHENKN